MTKEVSVAPAEESNNTEATNSEVVEDTKEETVGEVLDRKEDSVPLATFLELKNSNKEMSRELKELRQTIDDGATKKEVASDIKSLAEKYDVDENLLEDLVKSAKSEASKELDSKIESRLAPLEARGKEEKRDAIFNEHFKKAMANMPEYEGVVNESVIKSLSLSPSNSSKTFPQLIEEAYGHLLTGKRTMDTASTRTGKEDNIVVDSDRAKKDPEYFKEVMSNPVLKKQYNESMMNRLTSIL